MTQAAWEWLADVDSSLDFIDADRRLRALALWQPYASLVADGLKPIETRLWSTGVRGRFVVCATKQLAPRGDYARVLGLLEARGIDPAPYRAEVVSRGCALGVASLLDCRPMTPEDEPGAWVSTLAEDGRRRFAWVLAPKPYRLDAPRAVRGFQGWFRVPVAALDGSLSIAGGAP